MFQTPSSFDFFVRVLLHCLKVQRSGTPHQLPKKISQHQLQGSWDPPGKTPPPPKPPPKSTPQSGHQNQALSSLHCCVQLSLIGDASKKLRPHQLPKSLNPKPSKLSRWVCASWTMGEAANSTIKAATSPGTQILRGSRPPVWSSFELAG